VLNGHGLVLGLLQEFSETGTTVEQELGGGIQVGTELGKGSDFTVLSKEKLKRTSDLLHGLDLSSGTDTRHGKTDVNSGTDTLEEKLSFQENLTVSDGNDVGGNVSGHITTLGLNDGKGSHGTTTEGLVHLGSTLEETRVQVEDITRVGLTTRGTTKKKGHLTVSDGLLGQVIVDDKRVLSVVTEVFTHGSTRVRSQELKRGRVGGRGSNDDRVLEGIVLLKGLDELSDGRTLLTDGNVHTVKLLDLIGSSVPLLLVQDGVKGDGSLSGLTVTNDKLTLSTTNGHHGVDTLDTSLHGLVDGLTRDNTGGLNLDTLTGDVLERTLSIDGVTEGIDDTAQETSTDGDVDDSTSTLDNVTFLDETVVTENDNTDVVRLQVQGHTLQSRREFNHFFGLHVLQTVDTGNTVTDGEDTTSLLDIKRGRGSKDTLLEDRRDLSSARLRSSSNDAAGEVAGTESGARCADGG